MQRRQKRPMTQQEQRRPPRAPLFVHSPSGITHHVDCSPEVQLGTDIRQQRVELAARPKTVPLPMDNPFHLTHSRMFLSHAFNDAGAASEADEAAALAHS